MKSKDNNNSLYFKKDLKDIEYFTYYKKGHYATTYPIVLNINKILVGNLRHYTIKE